MRHFWRQRRFKTGFVAIYRIRGKSYPALMLVVDVPDQLKTLLSEEPKAWTLDRSDAHLFHVCLGIVGIRLQGGSVLD
jgi:hypothetical protein